MPAENLISIIIPPELLTQVKGILEQLKTLLQPYLSALSGDEIQSLFKMNDKSLPLVEKCIKYSKTNPQFLPSFVDIAEWERDFKVVSDLFDIIRPLTELHAGLKASATLAGSDCMTAAMSYYNTVKQGDKANVPGAKVIFEDLSKRFVKKSGSKENAEGQTPQA